MKGAWATAILLGATLLGCGNSDGDVTARITLPLHLPLACPSRSTLGPKLTASLVIGGHDVDCKLSVDPLSFAVSGSCPDVTPATVRPLLLIYEAKGSGTLVLPVLYRIGFVNLCDDVLVDVGNDVAVSFTNSAGAEETIYQQSQVDALPSAIGAQSCEQDLDYARGWARSVILERQLASDHDLDEDHDTNSNLAEACGFPSTLF